MKLSNTNVMTQEEKYSLHYPYKVMCDNWDNPLNARQLDLMASHGFERYKLFLRSFDKLTKECVQADYNDGKPFVPIEELALLDYDLHSLNYISVHTKRLPFEIIQQLLRWHFQVGFEPVEYIEVTDENNPYI